MALNYTVCVSQCFLLYGARPCILLLHLLQSTVVLLQINSTWIRNEVQAKETQKIHIVL